MNLLEVKNLSLEFKQEEKWNPVLSSVSFSLKKGETLGIVGESGSGKSVTALSIMHLLSEKNTKITEGEIFFDVRMRLVEGEKEQGERSRERLLQHIRGNRIAMIFQEPMTSLNPVLKCGKQVTEAILLHTKLSKKEAKEKTIKLFNDVQLPNPQKIFNTYPHELSGGQKQRVMIAMAMSCNPDILIADEPTTALDVTVQKNILELLKQLQEKYGMSIIFISHDLGVIAQIAHRVLVMYKGAIVEQGDVKTIFSHPQHPYTKSLLTCRPKLEEKLIRPFTSTLFQIQNLNKFYPIRKQKLFEKQSFFHALENINLEIFEGETLGLVGESGCGKTTLGRTLLRLIELDSGNIFYKGNNLKAFSFKEMRNLRKEIQIVLQDPYSSLNQRLTVGQMLIEPMQVHDILSNDKKRNKRAIELLERVGLNEEHLHRYPHQFSGGQRQRIAIARALTVNPSFIVCDESVSALDVSVQAQVLNLLNDLKKEFHLTYLFISHDLSVVKYMSDRIAVMRQGKIVELNDAESIYRNPQTEYTRALIEAIPQIDSPALQHKKHKIS
ncbi:MAG: ABC transporter ATP-binding protein [Lentimicrobiaceae bacterium]|nr:ABC transporter ATP-binding protein [Lentimicrobiaceae bacterium]